MSLLFTESSIEEYTKEFFENEKEFLLSQYPGLTLHRLNSELSNYSTSQEYKDFFSKLKEGIPLEYISNRAYFYRSEFYVNNNVLIPRSETEILVEHGTNFAKKIYKTIDGPLKVCDIGTGSGAIILSLLAELDFPVHAKATDISPDAIDVASKNNFFLRYKYPKKSCLEFIKTDRMEGIDSRFHLILSNPPYIKESEDRHKVHEQVEGHEPHLALYLKDEEYDQWFRELFKQVETNLYSHGLFFMEGHEDHLGYQKAILEEYDFEEVEVIKDYTGRDRFLKGIRKWKNYS